MALEAVIGGALGGLLRFAPEVLKFFDRKNERKHELALHDKELELVKVQGNTRLDTVRVEGEANAVQEALGAIREAYAGMRTGIAWIDAISASVRPIITYAFGAGYLYLKITTGEWTDVDTGIFSGILNFWFLGRVFEKYTAR